MLFGDLSRSVQGEALSKWREGVALGGEAGDALKAEANDLLKQLSSERHAFTFPGSSTFGKTAGIEALYAKVTGSDKSPFGGDEKAFRQSLLRQGKSEIFRSMMAGKMDPKGGAESFQTLQKYVKEGSLKDLGDLIQSFGKGRTDKIVKDVRNEFESQTTKKLTGTKGKTVAKELTKDFAESLVLGFDLETAARVPGGDALDPKQSFPAQAFLTLKKGDQELKSLNLFSAIEDLAQLPKKDGGIISPHLVSKVGKGGPT